ncbi:hypothetical protein [Saccharolobus islandicus]|uniref:Uncharacterized protein n=1 Tax=Saccharolobus islandicus (strain REY15A) TaxID=930945 RepID=F0NHN1_SACI5|nr:hypothetical protein [Sulfolobus islandicus]ADX85395.1 hypothetical protein SiRe_1328 [Sulfolobus islandicus REY15A]
MLFLLEIIIPFSLVKAFGGALLSPNQLIRIPLEVYVSSSNQGTPIQFIISISYLNSVYQQSQYQQQIGLYVSPLILPNIPL